MLRCSGLAILTPPWHKADADGASVAWQMASGSDLEIRKREM